jgi:predicted component of type VI protein secretion system
MIECIERCVVNRTLLEKLDTSCAHFSLLDSIRNQVQRIISTRTYLGDKPLLESYVTGFGVPEIVDQFTDNGDNHFQFRDIVREQILQLEPRLRDVKVDAIGFDGERGSCEIRLVLQDIEVEERFFF